MKNVKNIKPNKEPILHINGVPSFKNLSTQDFKSFISTLEFQVKTFYKDKARNTDTNKDIPP